MAKKTSSKRKTDQGWKGGDKPKAKPPSKSRSVKTSKTNVATFSKMPLAEDDPSSEIVTPAQVVAAQNELKKPREKVTHRVVTHKSDGSKPATHTTSVVDDDMKVPIGEAMRKAVADLGPVNVDDQIAGNQMRELATCYEHVTRCQAALSARQAATKTAREALDSAQNLLNEKIRAFTHPKNLPLFDQKKAEEDMDAMLTAAKEVEPPSGPEPAAAVVSDEQPSEEEKVSETPPDSEDIAEAVVEDAESVEGADEESAALKDDIPF